jgi:hypothetical protein
MRRMKLSRLVVAASLTLAFLTVWLGACSSGEEPCGENGVKNGVCQVGPTCPAGSAEEPTPDPDAAPPAAG